MNGDDKRLRELESFALLTNRMLMDFLSLQIDAGHLSLDGIKAMVAFSATEVIRGSPSLEHETRHFEKIILDRFDTTFEGRK